MAIIDNFLLWSYTAFTAVIILFFQLVLFWGVSDDTDGVFAGWVIGLTVAIAFSEIVLGLTAAGW